MSKLEHIKSSNRSKIQQGTHLSIITIELLSLIKKHYKLQWSGTHDIIHWNRVYDNGIKLSTQPGVNSKVVQLFSIFHDSERHNEHTDPQHGYRGSRLAIKLRDNLPINDHELDLLTTACSLHTSAKTHENITVKACFDSDRLDLGRVDIYPKQDLLCTPFAKQKTTIDNAYRRSLVHELPGQPFGLGQGDAI